MKCQMDFNVFFWYVIYMNSSKSTLNSSNPEEFRKFIEIEVLKIIKKLAEEGKTPKDKVRNISQLTLDLIKPGMTIEQLYQGAVKLDDTYSELAPVVSMVMKEYEEKYEKKAIEYVSQLIKSKDYDQAQNMVQKVLQFKMAG